MALSALARPPARPLTRYAADFSVRLSRPSSRSGLRFGQYGSFNRRYVIGRHDPIICRSLRPRETAHAVAAVPRGKENPQKKIAEPKTAASAGSRFREQSANPEANFMDQLKSQTSPDVRIRAWRREKCEASVMQRKRHRPVTRRTSAKEGAGFPTFVL